MTASPWARLFGGSPARRPAYRIPGNSVVLDTEYPIAVSPLLSTAILGIDRHIPSPPLVQSCCCNGTAGKMPPVTSNRSEEHTSELQSHSFISYAVFSL